MNEYNKKVHSIKLKQKGINELSDVYASMSIETIAKRLEELKKENDYNNVELAKIMGVTKSCFSKYINKKASPKLDKLMLLANHFGINLMWFYDENAPKYKNVNKVLTTNANKVINLVNVPVYEYASCGNGCFFNDNNAIIDYDVIEEDKYKPNDYYVVASGDSMVNVGIIDGARVHIRPQDFAEDKDIVLACICDDNVAFIKRYKKLEDGCIFVSENSDQQTYYPKMFIGKDVEKVKILGKVIGAKINF